VYAPVRTINHFATLADQRAALERVRAALAAGARFAFNSFVPGFEVVAEAYGDPVEGRVGVDGADYHIVSTTLVDEAERVARRHRDLYRDGDLIAERGTPLALIPQTAVRVPVRGRGVCRLGRLRRLRSGPARVGRPGDGPGRRGVTDQACPP
jgi:hypothetical protein